MSSENWKICRIEDIAIDVAMGPFGSDLKVDNFIEKGVPVIKGQNLNQNGFEDENFSFVSEEKAQSLKRCLAYPDDLVFTHRGTIGQVGIIPKNRYPYYLVSQSQMLLKVNLDLVDPYFLLYFFKSPSGQFELLKNSSQVGVPAISSPTKSLKGVQITLPPLPTQRRIAAILTALDDKIELNRRMNATLEGIAQALWQEWFGKYARGEEELPEGWRWGKLDEMYKTTSGGTPSRVKPEFFENGTIEWVKSKELKEIFVVKTEEKITELALKNSSAKLLPAKSVLVAMYGATVGEVSILSKSATCNQAVCAILPNSNYPFSYAFQFLSNENNNLKNLATGAAQQNISQELIQNLELPIPSVSALKKYQDIVEPLFEIILMNLHQSCTLTALRDTLLPRLMRGEIDL